MRRHTIVMTGASRGIGRIAVTDIAASQPQTHLVLLVRGDSSELVEEIEAVGGSVTVVPVDLASLHSVADAAEMIAEQVASGDLPPVGALVCNAGVQHTNALTTTTDGFESTFAVNVLANHVLLRRLEPHLHPRARVVVTVSDTHFGDLRHNLGMVPGPCWGDVEKLARVGAFPNPDSVEAGRTAYSTSKLAAIYLVHEYARRFPVEQTVLAFNPGFVPGTDLARDADAASRFVMRWVLPLLALTPLATSPRDAGRFLAEAVLGAKDAPSGAYIDRDVIASSSPESYDRPREDAAWKAVDELTAPFLPPKLTRPEME